MFDISKDVADFFFDDVPVKGPSTRYDDQESAPGIRRFVLKHLENLDAVLFNMELAGASINAAKSQWCQSQIEIVGYLCGPDGRRPPERKVLKIREWNAYRDISAVRSFLGLTGCF